MRAGRGWGRPHSLARFEGFPMMGRGEVIPAGNTPAVFRSRLWHASSRSSEYPGAILNPLL